MQTFKTELEKYNLYGIQGKVLMGITMLLLSELTTNTFTLDFCSLRKTQHFY